MSRFGNLFGAIAYCYRIIFRGLSVSDNVKFRGFPKIFIDKGCRVVIEEGVVLNSLQYRYHVAMHSRMYIFSEGESAIIRIGEKSRIHGTCIHARSRVTIGKNCLIGANCQIIDSNGHLVSTQHPEARLTLVDVPMPVEIGNNVWIGCNCIILPGVSIGSGSVVAAGTVVSKSVPEGVLVGGNPFKVLRKI